MINKLKHKNMESKQPKEQQINPAWLAAEKYQGSIIINDPAWR